MRTTSAPVAIRNPRLDPQSGDIIQKGTGDRFIKRIVAGRVGEMIQYQSKECGMTKVCNLKAWRIWAADATIITHGA